MEEDIIVHFVCFYTSLDMTAFTRRWEEYSRSVNSDMDVTLQQCKKNNSFSYIAQHRCTAGELKFAFTKTAKRSPHIAQISIVEQEAGGYSLLQLERKAGANANESKVFVFINSPQADLDVYRNLLTHGKLNIYSAYYENCKYAYILEYFVPNKYAVSLIEQLKNFEGIETGIYKQYALEKV